MIYIAKAFEKNGWDSFWKFIKLSTLDLIKNGDVTLNYGDKVLYEHQMKDIDSLKKYLRQRKKDLEKDMKRKSQCVTRDMGSIVAMRVAMRKTINNTTRYASL